MKETPQTSFIDEPHFTLNELAERSKVHRDTLRKWFLDEPDVLRFGHPTSRKKRQYYSLRIPRTVAERVFSRMRVRG